ncbi:glycosyltransferase [Hydrogenophaga sp.]|uniref:glycosyltransferase n=1 Tax=Hydrogenophaga sp. TaxID=1904254 RepID=UPI003F6B5169
MWLLNHDSARAFELKMLKEIGVGEIFTPKSYPAEISFRSASVSYEEDAHLTIPADDLTVLNSQDWYGQPSQAAWDIANRYFDACFFTLYKPQAFSSLTTRFKGALLWRAYGQVQGVNHSQLLDALTQQLGNKTLQRLGDRLWFAQAHDHLHVNEPPILAKRKLDLPLGMLDTTLREGWRGGDGRIYFLCPDIGQNAHYKSVYQEFKKQLGDLPHAVAGSQAVETDADHVLGYVTAEEHARNMREFRVMFYHSQEKYQIHYHPFEAVRAGMPLVFMAGGMLDRLGGLNLPGRCATYAKAREKLKRLLAGDTVLQQQIADSQAILLEAMAFKSKIDIWREALERVRSHLSRHHHDNMERSLIHVPRCKRIAVVVPLGYRGGSLRGSKLLAQALQLGAVQNGQVVEVTLLHLDDPQTYTHTEFEDLPPSIKTRSFKWRTLKADEARRAMRYAGHTHWEPRSSEYLVVDDGIKQLEDCDLWVVVSDRILRPLLPLRPVVHMVYDYLQRYVPILPKGADKPFINAARLATQVWVTTEFTRQDALQYAGVNAERVAKLPMLAPAFVAKRPKNGALPLPYFVWTTNSALYKNHEHALRALKLYYDNMDGTLDCHVTGVNTQKLLKQPPEHLKHTMAWVRNHEQLKRRLHWDGELPEDDYQNLLESSAFLWHAGRIDNDTFSVVEAAGLGVPALSSDYPPMREIDAQFGLNLAWMDAGDPKAMARALKDMEAQHLARRALLPSAEQLASQSVERLATTYWKAASECL